MSIEVVTAIASSLTKILIYNEGTPTGFNGQPGAKVLETTSFDGSTTGIKTFATSISFERGKLYWIGAWSNIGTLGLRSIPSANTINIGSAPSGNSGYWNHYSLTLTFNNAANSAPSIFSGGALAQAPAALIQMRA
jgi:hypothetical protein